MNGGTNEITLAEIARRLDEANIGWVVIAGAAASVYGATRPLTDIDLLVPAAEGKRVAALFPEAMVKPRADGRGHTIVLPGFDLVAGVRWDDVEGSQGALDLDAAMTARVTHHEILGVSVPVCPPEDVILLKALWGRGPEVGKHDWEDVEAMLASGLSLDWEYLQKRGATCGPRDRVEQALRRVDEMRKKGT
jgi:hypothetical protein